MTKVVTKEVRFSYVHVFEKPKKTDDVTGELKDGPYSVSLLIPKTDTETIKAIEDMTDEVIRDAKAGIFKGSDKMVKRPLRDGDEEKDAPEYAGMMFITANSYNNKPAVLRPDGTPIASGSPEAKAEAMEEFYSGCYGRASIELYPFNKKSKGVACGLRAIMKTRDGEHLGGASVDAYSDFGIEKPTNEFD